MPLTDNWKKVKIIDLFDIQSGTRLTKKDWGEPIYQYIGSSSINNGITGMCNQWNHENVITLCSNGSVGYSFLQKEKVYVSDNCNVLYPKYVRTDYIDLFICTVLTKIFTTTFCYGKPLNLTRLREESVYLPFKNNHIDWEWIEEFMKALDANIIKIKYKTSTSPVNTDTWKKFNITDLFNIQGGKTVIKEDWGEPIYPYVGSSSINNGITGKCNQWNYENTISINSTGSVGYAFWHPYKFLLSSNCRTLIPKFNITNNIGLFICTILTKVFTNNYSYGKNLTTTRLQQESIYLPEKDGKPDWEYMENFMNELIQK